MSVPAASDTRSPLSASREISACSAGGLSPAATRRAPSSLWSRARVSDRDLHQPVKGSDREGGPPNSSSAKVSTR
jgi:hypothetical protein